MQDVEFEWSSAPPDNFTKPFRFYEETQSEFAHVRDALRRRIVYLAHEKDPPYVRTYTPEEQGTVISLCEARYAE